MKNYLFCVCLFAALLSGCGESTPNGTESNITTDDQNIETRTSVSFHPKAAELFESYSALEKEKLDFSSFENEASAQTFYGELEKHIDGVLDAVQAQIKDRDQYLQKMKEQEGFSMQADLDFSKLKEDKRIQVLSIIVGAYLNPEDEINTKSKSQATAISHVVYHWSSNIDLDSIDCMGSVKDSHKKEKEKYLRITKLDPTMASVQQIYPDGFHIEVRVNYEKPS